MPQHRNIKFQSMRIYEDLHESIKVLAAKRRMPIAATANELIRPVVEQAIRELDDERTRLASAERPTRAKGAAR